MVNITYRSAIIIYCIILIILFSPFMFGGKVLAPHRLIVELAAEDQKNDNLIENRKFNDHPTYYIPEVNESMHGARSSWLRLWHSQNELGRPTCHSYGFSQAYTPSWLAMMLTGNPWKFITFFSLIICFLTGFFVLLYAREAELLPISGLIAGVTLAASPLFMYWITFPMFFLNWCWAAGALWAVTRLAKRRDFLGWSVLSFSVYSILLSGYPQYIVFQSYLLCGYTLWLSWKQRFISRISMFTFLMLVSSAVIVGAALSFPVYRDLAISWIESARVSPDPSYYLARLPKFTNFSELIRVFVLCTVPCFYGNPSAPSFPFFFEGLSITIFVIFFALFGLFTTLKKTWGWWLAIMLCCLPAFMHALYLFGVNYLLFNISRANLLDFTLLPLTVIIAVSLDAFFKPTKQDQRKKEVFFSGAVALLVIGVGVAYGFASQTPIHWLYVAGTLLVAAMLMVQYNKSRPIMVMLALAATLAMSSSPLMLMQDPEQIVMSSPFVEKVRADLAPGSRYAVAAPSIPLLPPNLNALFGLPSVHTYNSLSPTRYHTLIHALGGELHTYGRFNISIAPDYSSPMFWMSNISLVLSVNKLEHENLEPLGEEAGINFYRVVSRMGESMQAIPPPQLDLDVPTVTLKDPREWPESTPVKLLDKGDVLEFEVRPAVPSLFLLSQKFHRDWKALAHTREGWQTARTVEVNGVFQGVVLPSEADRVRLEYKPFARYAWSAHVFWLCLLFLAGVKWVCKRRQRASSTRA